MRKLRNNEAELKIVKKLKSVAYKKTCISNDTKYLLISTDI